MFDCISLQMVSKNRHPLRFGGKKVLYFAVLRKQKNSAQAIIGSMELSQDQKELFVAFHEPAESGLNGHVWVYDTQDGALLRKYDNVCYQPVKIMYKKK